MSCYLGIPCAQCEHVFNKDDDVVVCPTCGAPYHRACYRAVGHCALEAQHAPDFEWKRPVPSGAPGEPIRCKSCNTVNPGELDFCQMCGDRLVKSPTAEEQDKGIVARVTALMEEEEANDPPSEPMTQWEQSGNGDSWSIDGVSARELAASVGNHAPYFLRQFQILANNRFHLSWNWCGFLFRYFYFFYHKLYLLGALVGLFFVLTGIPDVLYTIELFKSEYALQMFGVSLAHDPEVMNRLLMIVPITRMMQFVMAVACGLFTNKALLRKTLSNVFAVRSIYAPAQGHEYREALSLRGKPNRLSLVLLIGAYFIFYSYLGSYLFALTGLS